MIFNNNDILDKHKKDITCDLCKKRIWFFQKFAVRIAGIKENIWKEYYHVKCLKKYF